MNENRSQQGKSEISTYSLTMLNNNQDNKEFVNIKNIPHFLHVVFSSSELILYFCSNFCCMNCPYTDFVFKFTDSQ